VEFLERGDKGYRQYMFSAKIVKTVLKSCFYMISPDFNLISPIFEFFERFSTLSLYILTRKIVRFYESNRDFNNLDQHHRSFSKKKALLELRMHFVQYVSYMKSQWNISLFIVETTRKFGLDSWNGGFYPGVVQVVYQLFFTNVKL